MVIPNYLLSPWSLNNFPLFLAHTSNQTCYLILSSIYSQVARFPLPLSDSVLASIVHGQSHNQPFIGIWTILNFNNDKPWSHNSWLSILPSFDSVPMDFYSSQLEGSGFFLVWSPFSSLLFASWAYKLPYFPCGLLFWFVDLLWHGCSHSGVGWFSSVCRRFAFQYTSVTLLYC